VTGGAAFTVKVTVDEEPPRDWEIAPAASGWLEPELDLGVPRREAARISIDVPSGSLLSLYHLWLYQAPP
jgi:hypothetical protein